MTENIESLILEHLRAIRADVVAVKEDAREIKRRLTSLETGVAGLRRDHARYDRLAEPVERIERRLELRTDV